MTAIYNASILAQLTQLVKRFIAWVTRDDDGDGDGRGVEDRSW